MRSFFKFVHVLLLCLALAAGTILGMAAPAAAECPGSQVGHLASANYTYDIVVEGSYAYITDGSYGMRVVDISDPSNPTEVGHLPANDNSYAIAVSGSYAYVTDLNTGLKIVDISTPSSPNLLSTVTTWNRAWEVAIYKPTPSSQTTYALLSDGSGGLRVIDVSDPNSPVEKGRLSSRNYTYAASVSGTTAYVADGSGGLVVVDISDPDNPRELGRASSNNYSYDVAVQGNYVYVADGNYGLRIFDVSDPANPSEVSHFSVANRALWVSIQGDRVFLSDASYGLRIINVSDPTNPQEVAYIPTANYAQEVFVDGKYLYYCDGSYGLRIYDATDCLGIDPGGRGDISFVLSWTYSGSSYSEGPDIDLWVEDPNGYHLSASRDGYGLGPTPNGGRIDQDDQGGTGPGDGSGPERAYWPSGEASPGTYSFGVRYYDGDGTANYTIKIYFGNSLYKSYTGTLTSQGRDITVGTIEY